MSFSASVSASSASKSKAQAQHHPHLPLDQNQPHRNKLLNWLPGSQDANCNGLGWDHHLIILDLFSLLFVFQSERTEYEHGLHQFLCPNVPWCPGCPRPRDASIACCVSWCTSRRRVIQCPRLYQEGWLYYWVPGLLVLMLVSPSVHGVQTSSAPLFVAWLGPCQPLSSAITPLCVRSEHHYLHSNGQIIQYSTHMVVLLLQDYRSVLREYFGSHWSPKHSENGNILIRPWFFLE